MSTIKKDTTVTSVTISKQRNKCTSFGVNPDRDILYIHYDIIMMDASNNEVYTVSQNNIKEIPKERWTEPHIAACIDATKTMIQTEL